VASAALATVLAASTFIGMTAVEATASGAATSGGKAIVVGFDVDQSGPGAGYNVPAYNVSKAEIKQINSHGGIKGRQIKTVTCNDESTPTKVGACLQKLAGEGAVFIIQLTGSPAVIQSKSTVQKLQIPVISSTNASPTVPLPPDNTYIYTVAEPSTVWGPAYCNGMKRQHIKTIALLQDNTPTIAGFTPPLLKSMSCVKVVNTQTAPVDATNITAEVSRLSSPKADALMISTAEPSFDALANNTIKQQYPKTKVFDVATLCNNPSTWKLANPNALVGTVCPGAIDPANKVTQKVQKYLKSQLGSSFVLSQFTAEGWDGVNLMAQAMRKAPSFTGPALNKAVQSLKNVPSASGSPGYTLTLLPTKHSAPNGPCGIVMVQWHPTNNKQRTWPAYHAKTLGC